MTVDSLTEDHSGLIDGNSFLLCTRTCHNNGQENDGMELHYYLLHYPGLGEPEDGGREQIPKSMHMQLQILTQRSHPQQPCRTMKALGHLVAVRLPRDEKAHRQKLSEVSSRPPASFPRMNGDGITNLR